MQKALLIISLSDNQRTVSALLAKHINSTAPVEGVTRIDRGIWLIDIEKALPFLSELICDSVEYKREYHVFFLGQDHQWIHS